MTTDDTTEATAATEAGSAEAANAELKRPALIDMIVSQSGLKKKDVKPVVEATLAVLGQALSEGRNMNLAPLGRLRVTKTKALENGEVMTVRLRRSSQMQEQTEALETSPEDG